MYDSSASCPSSTMIRWGEGRGGVVYVFQHLRKMTQVRWLAASRRITRKRTSVLFFCWHAATIVSICFRNEVASSFCCNSLSASSRTRYLAVFRGSCLNLSNRHSLKGVAITRSTCTLLCSSSHCTCDLPCQLFPLFRSKLLRRCKYSQGTTIERQHHCLRWAKPDQFRLLARSPYQCQVISDVVQAGVRIFVCALGIFILLCTLTKYNPRTCDVPHLGEVFPSGCSFGKDDCPQLCMRTQPRGFTL